MSAQAQEIIVHDEAHTPLAPTVSTPMSMIEAAVASGASVEVLDRLMTLQERWDANQARKAFDAALSGAKARIAETKIVKNRSGHNKTRYADFAAYAEVVDPILADHGLSYRFETEQDDRIQVTCVLSHADGHSVRNSLKGPPDQTGNKNAIQAIGSTLTYLQRYTLTNALGLAATEDDDGQASAGDGPITSDQVSALRAVIVEVAADLPAFLAYMKVDRLEDLPASQYDRALKALSRKQQAKAS